MYFDGSAWVAIKPIGRNDSLWDSYLESNELNLFNAKGLHTYVSGAAIKSIGSSGNIDGVMRIGHNSDFPATARYFLSMDGQGIQSRSQQNLLSPMVDAPLGLNVFGGNVGIGVANPLLATLMTEGSEGNTIAMFRRFANSQGLSIIGDWPGIYFNAYFNNGSKSMSNSGYSGIINLNQDIGHFTFHIEPTPNTVQNQALSLPVRLALTAQGELLSPLTNQSLNLAPIAYASVRYRFRTVDGITTVTKEKEAIYSSLAINTTVFGSIVFLADDYLGVVFNFPSTGYNEIIPVLGANNISGSDAWPNRYESIWDGGTRRCTIQMEIDDITDVTWEFQVLFYGLK
jgi:hypothetical protein